jgi:hypothetical protein
MTLRDAMRGDMDRVFLNTDEFGETVRFRPADALTVFEGGSGPGYFEVPMVLTDPSEQGLAGLAGIDDQRGLLAVAKLSALTAGILAATGTQREPRRGDWIIIEDADAIDYLDGVGPSTWMVLTCIPDGRDGCTLTLRFESHHAGASRDGAEVR